MILVAAIAVSVAFLAGWIARDLFVFATRQRGGDIDLVGVKPRLREVSHAMPDRIVRKAEHELAPGERVNQRTGQVEYSAAWLNDRSVG